MAELKEYKKRPLNEGDGEREIFASHFDDSEGRKLLSNEQSSRRRWGLAAVGAALVLVVVAAIIVGVVVSRRSSSAEPQPAQKTPLSFDDLFNAKLSASLLESIKWMPASRRLYKVSVGADANLLPQVSVLVQDVSDNTSAVQPWKVLLSLPTNITSVEGFGTLSFSPDEKYLLFSTNARPVHRYSITASYYVMNVETMSYPVRVVQGAVLRYIRWTKAGSNLLLNIADEPSLVGVIPQEELDTPSGVVFPLNERSRTAGTFAGIPDWLYEEEILNSAGAIWPSPSEKYVAFATIFDQNVSRFDWVRFGSSHSPYVQVDSVYYPKVGSTNPTVRLSVAINISSSTRGLVTLHPPSGFGDYLMQVRWLNATFVSALWMERLQRNASLAIYELPAGGQPVATLEWTAPKGWIENYPYAVAENGTVLLLRLPLDSPKVPGLFVHLARIRLRVSQRKIPFEPEFLTSGQWEVAAIKRVDDEAGVVWVMATVLGPGTRHLYRIPLNGSKITSPDCVTCIAGSSCLFNSVEISADGEGILWRCEGPGIPRVQVATVGSDGHIAVTSVLESNDAFAKSIDSYSLPKQELLRLPINGLSVPAMRLVPPNVSSGELLPTLFFAYNGPLVQTVTARHFLLFQGPVGLWHAFLASRHKMQIIIVDGRGTPYLGDDYGKSQYKQLGTPDSEDQIAAGHYAIRHFQADPKRMAFWGWSYGGFLSSFIASSKTNVFGTCIAVAPVTDWRYYDTAYTERFMMRPTPDENLAGYEKDSIINRAGDFGKTKYLIVHGTGDDNVHFQNMAQLAAALTKNLVQFRMQFYTDEKHDLSGTFTPNTPQHFYRLLTNFLLTSFSGKETGV